MPLERQPFASVLHSYKVLTSADGICLSVFRTTRAAPTVLTLPNNSCSREPLAEHGAAFHMTDTSLHFTDNNTALVQRYSYTPCQIAASLLYPHFGWVATKFRKKAAFSHKKIKVLIFQVQSVPAKGKWEDQMRGRRYELFKATLKFKCPLFIYIFLHVFHQGKRSMHVPCFHSFIPEVLR